MSSSDSSDDSDVVGGETENATTDMTELSDETITHSDLSDSDEMVDEEVQMGLPQLFLPLDGPQLTDKSDDLQYDIGAYLAFDIHPLNVEAYQNNANEELNREARENAQLLLNRFFSLNVERLVGSVGAIVRIPKSTTPFARQKPLPAKAALTRWEKFARIKGIQKRNRSKKVWDETTQTWKRRYGFNRANDEMKDWVITAKPTDQPGEDPWAARKKAKAERVKKGIAQQQRNISEAQNFLIQSGQPKTAQNIRRDKKLLSTLDHAMVTSKKSTASAGKFQKNLEREPKAKQKYKKRDPTTPSNSKEKEKNLKAVDRIFKKDAILDVNKAVSVNKLQKEKQRRLAKESDSSPHKGKGKGKGGSGKGKGKGKGRK
jgi:regulator of ribosome biosynthesis